MTEKKINEEQLEQVAGGGVNAFHERYDREYTIKIDKYDTANYIGRYMYFKYYERNFDEDYLQEKYHWVVGKLLRSYEKTANCGTIRTADVQVEDGNEVTTGTISLNLDNYVAYIKG